MKTKTRWHIEKTLAILATIVMIWSLSLEWGFRQSWVFFRASTDFSGFIDLFSDIEFIALFSDIRPLLYVILIIGWLVPFVFVVFGSSYKSGVLRFFILANVSLPFLVSLLMQHFYNSYIGAGPFVYWVSAVMLFIAIEAQIWRNSNRESGLTKDFSANHADTRWLVSSPNSDMVTDVPGGLQWMRCALGQSWNGHSCTGQGIRLTWCDALEAVKEENRRSELSGPAEWRLPCVEELKSLVQLECLPTIAPEIFPSAPDAEFWTSEPWTHLDEFRGNDRMHIVNFRNGRNFGWYVNACAMVRLVRHVELSTSFASAADQDIDTAGLL